MALYDENGKITIDENAAQDDIRKLNAIHEKLSQARESARTIQLLSQEFEGDFSHALNEALRGLEKSIMHLETTAEKMGLAIEKTVRKYQTIDKNLENTIISTK